MTEQRPDIEEKGLQAKIDQALFLEEKTHELFYWRDRQLREVDFVVKEGLQVKQLIQVCWDPTDEETKRREIKGLVKAMEEFRLRKGLVITEDFEGEEKVKGERIIYRPLWKWLLER